MNYEPSTILYTEGEYLRKFVSLISSTKDPLKQMEGKMHSKTSHRYLKFSAPTIFFLLLSGIMLSLFVWQLEANALTLHRTSLVALMKSSDYVVHGIVEDIQALEQEKQPTILAEFSVLEVLKGEKVPQEVRIRFQGKITEKNLVTAPPHEATLSPTEELVLFLTRWENGEITVTDGIQGKFTISETDGGEKVVRSTVGAIPLADQDPEDWLAEMPLTQFLKHLRKIATYPQ